MIIKKPPQNRGGLRIYYLVNAYITRLIYEHASGGQGSQGGQHFVSFLQSLMSVHFIVHSVLAFFLAFFLPPFSAIAGADNKVTASIATSNFFILKNFKIK